MSTLAQTPPLGWNSWDCYGMSITEAEVFRAADAMRERLHSVGYEYVVIDAGWFNAEPKAGIQKEAPALQVDDYGRLFPDVSRFPSTEPTRGFQELTRQLHARGVKLGIHLMRGIPRIAVERNTPVLGTKYRAQDIVNRDRICGWNPEMYGVDMSKPGAQAYYDSVGELVASWGIDFVKADDMAAPYYADEIEGLSKALRRSGRDIVLSLSPGNGATPENHEHTRAHAQMRRISADLWDYWDDPRPEFSDVKGQFAIARAWQGKSGPGHWADLDMLPIGNLSLRHEGGAPRNSRLSTDEKRTMLSLWSMFQSPLMLGGDLATLDELDLSLLTNRAVLEIDQRGFNSREAYQRGDVVVWTCELPNSRRAVAVFNLGDSALSAELSRSELGFSAPLQGQELWTEEPVAWNDERLSLSVAPHGVQLLRLQAAAT